MYLKFAPILTYIQDLNPIAFSTQGSSSIVSLCTQNKKLKFNEIKIGDQKLSKNKWQKKWFLQIQQFKDVENI